VTRKRRKPLFYGYRTPKNMKAIVMVKPPLMAEGIWRWNKLPGEIPQIQDLTVPWGHSQTFSFCPVIPAMVGPPLLLKNNS